MARKTETVIITGDANNRDNGKHFLLTEMPAAQAESWANRALLAIGRSAAEIDTAAAPGGMAGIYTIGATALSRLRWEDAQPLLDEMFGCIQIIGDPTKPQATTRKLLEGENADIEEVTTRWQLREKVISLHLGFSLADRLSIFLQLLSAKPSISPNTSTSPSPSDASSPPA